MPPRDCRPGEEARRGCHVAFGLAIAPTQDVYITPAEHARIDKAVWLILNGQVTLGAHTVHVQSQTNPHRTYDVNGECSCLDFQQHHQNCKHRFAAILLRRALYYMTQVPAPVRWIADCYTGSTAVRGVAEEWAGVDGFYYFLPADGGARGCHVRNILDGAWCARNDAESLVPGLSGPLGIRQTHRSNPGAGG